MISTEENVWLSNTIRNFLRTKKKGLVVILGPTASGKTAFSLDVVEAIPSLPGGKRGEIVNADSRQLYRFLDIGTAKIRPEEMHGIPHHLFDVLDPRDEATAAWYKAEATRVIEEVSQRGNIPILVGGSMLYISALIDDLQFAGAADSKLRARLETAYEKDGGKALYARLAALDPETASAFSKENKVYVIRALEILEATGKRPSAFKQAGTPKWDLLVFGIQWPRQQLVARIHARTKQMFHDGWIDEVRSLLDRGYSADDPGMKSHGYREIAAALMNSEFRIQNSELKKLIEAISTQSRQYAKRQMTWWKSDQRIHWFDQP